MSTIHLGQMVVLRRDVTVWYDKIEGEIADQMAKDAAVGHWLDSAGEPLLYSKVASMRLLEDVTAVVTRTRGIQWRHWIRKPKGLVEGLVTIDGIPRYVMFKKDSATTGGSK